MNGSTPTAVVAASSRQEALHDIEASCATPVALMFFAAVSWLVVSIVFALITSVKLHSPTILADCAALSYGHTRPAANDAFVYGFASQAGLAAALWMLCRLGRVQLFGPLAITIAALFWNFGVALGVVGILRGETTGFEWIEFPNYSSAAVFSAFAVIGICGIVTFARRRVAEVYPAQWYIVAAILWFAWLYTTARLLLVWFPVRGVMQFLVANWYGSGLLWLWLGALALAILYYFIPKLTNGQVLSSRSLALIGFWTFATFAPWGGLYSGVPLPAWIISASIAGSVLTVVPLVANVINLWDSRRAAAFDCRRVWFTTSLVFLAISGVLTPAVAACPISAVTIVAEGVQLLTLYGFVGFAIFGAIYYIAPRLFLGETTCNTGGKVTWWCTLLGIVLFSGSMIFGGLQQGHNLRDGAAPFVNVMNGLKPFVRISTAGLLLLLVGNISLFVHVLRMLATCCRNCCCAPEPRVITKPAMAGSSKRR